MMTQIEKTNADQSYCTRSSDGVSGMSVTALAQFCGVDKSTITKLLNQISHSDPLANDLQTALKPYAGNDWRLLTNDPSGRVFIIDEVCHAVLEYYALEARKYKGKQIAVNSLCDSLGCGRWDLMPILNSTNDKAACRMI